jgi:hypothetical protein
MSGAFRRLFGGQNHGVYDNRAIISVTCYDQHILNPTCTGTCTCRLQQFRHLYHGRNETTCGEYPYWYMLCTTTTLHVTTMISDRSNHSRSMNCDNGLVRLHGSAPSSCC